MSANTKIEWADHTFNPWVGCQKVSPGCDHCYAESWAKRSGLVQWGPHAERRRTNAANWRQPRRWDEQARIAFAPWQKFRATSRLSDAELLERGFIAPRRPRVFCASLADVFDNAVPQGWRQDLFELIGETPHLDWLLLTKRIGNAEDMINLALLDDGPTWPWPHVWIGASIVNQEEADRDIPKLLAVPAAKRFLSMEPLLGPVDLTPFLWGKHDAVDKVCQNCPRDADCECGYVTRSELKLPALDWVIVGGESGHHARPMHPDWARALRDQCNAAGVPFFFKQWGEHGPARLDLRDGDSEPWRVYPDGYRAWNITESLRPASQWAQEISVHVGKKAAGRKLDGRTWDEAPDNESS